MASEAKGRIIVPVWVDAGVVKALVNNDGHVPVYLGNSGITLGVQIKGTDLTIPTAEQTPLTELDVTIKASDINVPVEEQSPLSSIQAQGYGYDGANWKKQGMVWTYNDRLADNVGGTKSGAGTYIAWSTTPPAGEVQKVEFVLVQNNSTAPSWVAIYVFDGTNTFTAGFKATPGLSTPFVVYGPFTLKPGDKAGVSVGGCLDGDVISGVVWGYKMKVNM